MPARRVPFCLALAAVLSMATAGLAACGGPPAPTPRSPGESALAAKDLPGASDSTGATAATTGADASTALAEPATLTLATAEPGHAAGGLPPTLSAAADPGPAATGPGADTVPALFDDDGQPAPTAYLLPARPLRSQAGLYATAAQLAWQELVSGPDTVVLDLDRLGGEAGAELLAQHVLGFRPTAPLTWFVKGSDGAAGVRVADRLTAQGVAPVFLVP